MWWTKLKRAFQIIPSTDKWEPLSTWLQWWWITSPWGKACSKMPSDTSFCSSWLRCICAFKSLLRGQVEAFRALSSLGVLFTVCRSGDQPQKPLARSKHIFGCPASCEAVPWPFLSFTEANQSVLRVVPPQVTLKAKWQRKSGSPLNVSG